MWGGNNVCSLRHLDDKILKIKLYKVQKMRNRGQFLRRIMTWLKFCFRNMTPERHGVGIRTGGKAKGFPGETWMSLENGGERFERHFRRNALGWSIIQSVIPMH